MSPYADLEESVESGAPVEIYGFEMNPNPQGLATYPVTHFRFTSSQATFSYAGQDYLPSKIRRSEISYNEDASSVTITIPRKHEIAKLFRGGLPPSPVLMEIRRFQREDAANGRRIFHGEVAEIEIKGSTAILLCMSEQSVLSHKIPRPLWQKSACVNMLYDARCKVNKGLHSVGGLVVAAVSGRRVIVTSADAAAPEDEYFVNGELVNQNGVRGFIESRTDIVDEFVLLTRPSGLNVGDTVTMSAGCDRSHEVCFDRFSNTINRNAFEAMPSRSVFVTGIQVSG